MFMMVMIGGNYDGDDGGYCEDDDYDGGGYGGGDDGDDGGYGN